MPRAIEHSWVVRLQTELLQPRVLGVIDEELVGRGGHCSSEKKPQTKSSAAASYYTGSKRSEHAGVI